MAADCHVEFAKLWHFVMWPSLEAQSASAYQISFKSDDCRLRYSDKNYFQNGGRPPSWIFEIRYFGHMTSVRTWFSFIVQNFALIGWFCFMRLRFARDLWRFTNVFWLIDWIIRWDITKGRFSIWRQSAILSLQNFGILLSSRPWKHNLRLHTKLVEIRWFPAEI